MQGKDFFFEKKKQKTFANRNSLYPDGPQPNVEKFFASFFQKRSPFFVSVMCFTARRRDALYDAATARMVVLLIME
jgi:hypothetical protein